VTKTLLVFGARNLGRTLARELAADGWSTAAVARSEETIGSFRDALPEALGLVGDARMRGDVERAFAAARERFGEIDLVVNAMTPGAAGRFGGGPLSQAPPEALERYVQDFVPAVFNVLGVGARVLADQGRGTLVQVTGGSARRGMPERGPWAAAAFATRALTQAVALELREQGVHAALLIVDATIESEKTATALEGKPPDSSTSERDVVAAIRYLEAQSPRGWTHELQITPRLDRWVP
jgi:NAD(P)-dependent dehydrogenase (short-subunit alcohol dehydrogenase family)